MIFSKEEMFNSVTPPSCGFPLDIMDLAKDDLSAQVALLSTNLWDIKLDRKGTSPTGRECLSLVLYGIEESFAIGTSLKRRPQRGGNEHMANIPQIELVENLA